MKVYLMHPDRDFESEREPLPNEAEVIQDLELSTIFHRMASGDEFIYEVVQKAFFTSLKDPDAVRYRQEILQDCLKYPDVIRQLYRIPIQSMENRQVYWLGVFTRYPSAILSGAREMLVMFVGLLRGLRQIADENAERFESRGFRRFFAMIQQELDDEYFEVVTQVLRELKFSNGVSVSAQLGRGNEGANYVLRKPHNSGNWINRMTRRTSPVYSFTLPPHDNAGARALEEIRDRSINVAANAVAQSAEHIDSFFKALRLELAFYIGCLNLYERLAELGEPVAFPQPLPAGERRLVFTGLYDLSLALTVKQKVVGNDLNTEKKDLAIITGANQGGKSTFLRSFGQAQLMMQCGMFVAADSFSGNLCSRLFTHYKREEDTTMTSGKFDEELSRMSAIVDKISPDSMVLFNESFAATNEREGSEVARQIIRALLDQHIQVFFVTHLYELAQGFYASQMENAIFLRAERKPGGGRTYKIMEGQPLQTSFGADLYHKIFEEDRKIP